MYTHTDTLTHAHAPRKTQLSVTELRFVAGTEQRSVVQPGYVYRQSY